MLPSDDHKSIVSEPEHHSVVEVVDLFEYHLDEFDGELEVPKRGIHGYDPFGFVCAIIRGSVIVLAPFGDLPSIL